VADLSITISNSLNVSGPSPTSKWGTMVWGVGHWAEDKDSYFTVGKNLAESIAMAVAVTPVMEFRRTISEGITVSSTINFGTLTDGSGYSYVFPNNVTDLDSRFIPTWTEGAEPSTSFSESSEPSTTWTES
jgi:hypothetical protein